MAADRSISIVTPSPLHSQISMLDDENGIQSAEKSLIDLTVAPASFVLPKCELPPKSQYGPVENFVASAVKEQHAKPDDSAPLKGYRAILEAIRFKSDLVMLERLLLALRTSGSGLTLGLLASSSNKHARLIHQLIRFNPFELPISASPANDNKSAQNQNPSIRSVSKSYRLADAYLHLIIALVSANSVFMVPTITALWKLLVTVKSGETAIDEPRTDRIHATLATILRLVPKARSEIFTVISSQTPFRTKPAFEIELYFKQALRTLEYSPSIESQILELILDRSLEMDVEIKINDGGEAILDTKEDQEEDIFQLDMEDDNESPAKRQDGGAAVSVNEMADKLDRLMGLVFEHVERSAARDPASIQTLYSLFLRLFESSILITHKSKFVQFILLHISGLYNHIHPSTNLPSGASRQPLYRDCTARLAAIVTDPFRATVTRQTGACYLASFISRSSVVTGEDACRTVCGLLDWAEGYVASLGAQALHAADVRDQCNLHSLFYTVCQSAFYILCFRGYETVRFFRTETALLQTSDASSRSVADLLQIDISSERWTKLCLHPLQPLRYCLESVRTEFLHFCGVYGLIDSEALKQLSTVGVMQRQALNAKRKKRVSKIKTAATLEKERLNGGVGGLGGGTNPLDSFFPFDPYLLRESHKHIEPFYIHWGDRDHLVDDASTGDNDEDGELYPTVDSDDDEDNDEDEALSMGDSQSESEIEDDLTEQQPMSFVSSNAASHSSVSISREAMQDKWAKEVRRVRAPSIENGSW